MNFLFEIKLIQLDSIKLIFLFQGPRVRLRLDGTDGCNDFWRLIDSKVQSCRN